MYISTWKVISIGSFYIKHILLEGSNIFSCGPEKAVWAHEADSLNVQNFKCLPKKRFGSGWNLSVFWKLETILRDQEIKGLN